MTEATKLLKIKTQPNSIISSAFSRTAADKSDTDIYGKSKKERYTTPIQVSPVKGAKNG